MITSDLMLVIPELALLGLASLVLVLDTVFRRRGTFVTYWLTQASLIIVIVLILTTGQDTAIHAFSGNFVTDPMSILLKAAICVITLVVFFYSHDYLREHGMFKGEYFVLGLFAVLGMMVMTSAASLLTVYLGLELLSLSLYALVAFDRDSRLASEAAMKYFVLGALASGMLLYGISMIYGMTGSLDLEEVGSAVAATGLESPVLVFGLVFVVVGVAFKLGAVPFHMWIPDVYHGAPTAVTLFISSTPKVAAFALAMRLLVDGLAPLQGEWQGMLVILAVLSMGLGNLVAIAQSNIKRMLAYSTISHVGFILLGILAGNKTGYEAAMFYTVVYAFMALGGFGMVMLMSRAGFEADNLEDFKGLNARSPWYAFVMLLLMFSMAGVPPTAGFFAKLLVLNAVVKVDMVWLALVGVTFSIVGAFYYIRVVKLMYFDAPVDTTPISAGLDTRVAISANGLAMLALGVYPSVLVAACATAIG